MRVARVVFGTILSLGALAYGIVMATGHVYGDSPSGLAVRTCADIGIAVAVASLILWLLSYRYRRPLALSALAVTTLAVVTVSLGYHAASELSDGRAPLGGWLSRPLQRVFLRPYVAQRPHLASTVAQLGMWKELRKLAAAGHQEDVALGLSGVRNAPADLVAIVRDAAGKAELECDWTKAAELWQTCWTAGGDTEALAKAQQCEKKAGTTVPTPGKVGVAHSYEGVAGDQYDTMALIWSAPDVAEGKPLRLLGFLPRDYAGRQVQMHGRITNDFDVPIMQSAEDFAIVDLAAGRLHQLNCDVITRPLAPGRSTTFTLSFTLPRQFADEPPTSLKWSGSRVDRREPDGGIWIEYQIRLATKPPRMVRAILPEVSELRMPQSAVDSLPGQLVSQLLLCQVGDPEYISRH